MKPEYDSKKF